MGVTTGMLCICIAGIMLMLYAGVALIHDKKYFTSAPEDIQKAIRVHEERFKGAHALGWILMIAAGVMISGSVIYASYDGIQRDFSFTRFFIRFLIMLDGYKVWDMIFLDWFLLTKPHFYQHYYPETEGCESFKHTGFNTRSQLLKLLVIFPVISLFLAGICMLIERI